MPGVMEKRGRPLVLCYHAISDTWEDALAVPLRVFEQQMRAVLKRGYRPATAAETLSARGKVVHVTFDDAFRSVAKALPVLERLGMPATVFACPVLADGGKALAVPELRAQVEEAPDELATMAWDELRSLIDRGFEVGSHTLTHPHLPVLGDDELRRELQESRERLEDGLGVACRFLAYPYGEEDERVRAAARSSGYEGAFALPGRQAPADVYAVPRVGIWRTDGSRRVTLKTSTLGRRLSDPVASMRARWPRLARRREPVVWRERKA
jgi:peptidoglycan/xylan/chitin deacetylase (PgdA/CDA1 family)